MLQKSSSALGYEYKFLITEDGSDSSQIVSKLRIKFPNLIYRHHEERLGRGRALREAWNEVEGDVYVYLDVDMATDLERLDAFRKLVESLEQFAMVTGSRYIRGAVTNRPFLRRLTSIAYNALVRKLFRTGVHDHQCGFKSFSKALVKMLSTEAKSDSWFWDTEVIVLAKKHGFSVAEIPIYWNERKGKRTPLKRLTKDLWIHGVGLLALTWRIYGEGFRNSKAQQ
jgi:glycosyltransferase involved in cell wall biosynthesis